jgi:hypothetical protein
MTRVGGGRLIATLESVGLVMGVEMCWEEWWSLVLLSDFLRAFIVWSVGVQSQRKDKSTSKKMASVEKSPGSVSLNAQRRPRYHKRT